MRQGVTVAVIYASVIAYFLWFNAFLPYGRDASIFLFIANNIAHGQVPYWAAMETKNPLVEYYWALFFLLFGDTASLKIIARVAESLYLGVTAGLLFWVAHRYSRNVYISALVGFTYLCVVLNGIITDYGMQIGLYQTLPELIAIILLLRLCDHEERSIAVWFGVAVFAAWFVKQTSLIALALPSLYVLWILRRNAPYRAYMLGVVTFLFLLVLWLLYLGITGNLEHYLQGTIYYRSTQIDALVRTFPYRVFSDLLIFSENFPYSIRAVSFWLAVCIAVSLIVVRRKCQTLSAKKKDILVINTIGLWAIGSVLAAISGLAFFEHYFLSCVAPIFLSLLLLGRVLCGTAWQKTILILLPVWLCVYLVGNYREHINSYNKVRGPYPMFYAAQRLNEIIKPTDRVFMWGTVMHYFSESKHVSDYPFNMAWYDMSEAVTPRERVLRMQEKFKGNPPDYVIAIYGRYLKWEGLYMTRLNPEILKQWTGYSYRLYTTIKPNKGRYSNPVYLFKRED